MNKKKREQYAELLVGFSHALEGDRPKRITRPYVIGYNYGEGYVSDYSDNVSFGVSLSDFVNQAIREFEDGKRK